MYMQVMQNEVRFCGSKIKKWTKVCYILLLLNSSAITFFSLIFWNILTCESQTLTLILRPNRRRIFQSNTTRAARGRGTCGAEVYRYDSVRTDTGTLCE